MSLSQTQIIRSLGEALAWFEKELAWGAPMGELRHLTGRIGELYAAMVTRGQMALAVNQSGYDVVSDEGERISVKTFTSSSHINFNASTLELADRVMVLQIVIDEGEPSIRELLDCSVEELKPKLKNLETNSYLPVHLLLTPKDGAAVVLADLKVVSSGFRSGFRVDQLENGTIQVWHDGKLEPQAKPVLRKLAGELGVEILNSVGNIKNTRSLGSDVLKALADQPPLTTSS
ncbi:DUF6998 domain-containing protein [Paracoccus jeotgali]|uniref:DUF6998 domain-containing protein n=1 Tax=Paracoccus jeotgali TaxID=2065379 RepID=A0A2K9MDJ6_9RHOB|nr:hypothetical protein [Paracoccus jeotgali]AUM73673.1 hypothetical protein CYR75_04680 [Paracoccus jeotgali]